MLVKRISFDDFLKEFEKYGRESQFSYEGKKALFNYLNELGEDLGEPIELDVIAICCDFTEFLNFQEFKDYYRYDIESMEDLYYQTTVIPIDDEAFIIQDF